MDDHPLSAADRLRELCHELLAERRLILASNRGPLEYHAGPDGTLYGRRGAGGVVTALIAVTHYADVSWIACAMGEGDRLAAERAGDQPIASPFADQRLSVQFITPPRSIYHKYYNVFCNPLLWFLQHYMWNSPYTPNIDAAVHDAWDNGYVTVNRAFAEAVAATAAAEASPPIVMLHDYHLYLGASYVRELLPDAIIQHFTHIPWPAPAYWQLLPNNMRQAICRGLSSNNIVGFQTLTDVRNFLHTCEAFLPDAEVDHRGNTVWRDGHLCSVRHYPISIDTADLQRLARSARVRDYEERLRPLFGEKTILRVDRAEPSKNIVRGFRAFELLLERYPEWLGRLSFIVLLVPSRTHIRQYQRYTDEVNHQIAAINGRFGTDNWQPIHLLYENNYPQAIAAMRHYDVLLVNAVIDGMNLVAKEGPAVNSRDGVLVLSETVGAFEELGDNALAVSPADIEGTAAALQTALTMPAAERARRAAALRHKVESATITTWLLRQLEDIAALV